MSYRDSSKRQEGFAKLCQTNWRWIEYRNDFVSDDWKPLHRRSSYEVPSATPKLAHVHFWAVDDCSGFLSIRLDPGPSSAYASDM